MKAVISLIVFVVFLTSASKPVDEEVLINHVQMIGSHNSYKQPIEKSLMEILLARDSNMIGLDYAHVSIQEQLDLGLRGL